MIRASNSEGYTVKQVMAAMKSKFVKRDNKEHRVNLVMPTVTRYVEVDARPSRRNSPEILRFAIWGEK